MTNQWRTFASLMIYACALLSAYIEADSMFEVELNNRDSVVTSIPPLNVAVCQLLGSANKTANMERAEACMKSSVASGAELVVLPECWNSPYDTSLFRRYAEVIPSGASSTFLSQMAALLQVWIIGGSIPEIDPTTDKIYNTCLVFSPNGSLVTIHRKMHLFDIDIPGKVTFRESDALSAGDQITTFESPFGVVGIGICYDLRFPEMSLLLRQRGARILVFPSAFSVPTGESHWEVLARARAIDTQTFVVMASPARSTSGYQAWGHSMIVDPWGKVIADSSHTPTIIHASLDFNRLEEVRGSIPVSLQRRPDIYSLSEN